MHDHLRAFHIHRSMLLSELDLLSLVMLDWTNPQEETVTRNVTMNLNSRDDGNDQ